MAAREHTNCRATFVIQLTDSWGSFCVGKQEEAHTNIRVESCEEYCRYDDHQEIPQCFVETLCSKWC